MTCCTFPVNPGESTISDFALAFCHFLEALFMDLIEFSLEVDLGQFEYLRLERHFEEAVQNRKDRNIEIAGDEAGSSEVAGDEYIEAGEDDDKRDKNQREVRYVRLEWSFVW